MLTSGHDSIVSAIVGTIHRATSSLKAVRGSLHFEVDGVEGEDMKIELMEILANFLILLLFEDSLGPSSSVHVIGKP